MSAPDIATLIQDAVSRAVTGALVQRAPQGVDGGARPAAARGEVRCGARPAARAEYLKVSFAHGYLGWAKLAS